MAGPKKACTSAIWRGQLVGALDAKRPVPVEIAERTPVIRAALGRLDHQRQVLVGRQDADRAIDATELAARPQPTAPTSSRAGRRAWGRSAPPQPPPPARTLGHKGLRLLGASHSRSRPSRPATCGAPGRRAPGDSCSRRRRRRSGGRPGRKSSWAARCRTKQVDRDGPNAHGTGPIAGKVQVQNRPLASAEPNGKQSSYYKRRSQDEQTDLVLPAHPRATDCAVRSEWPDAGFGSFKGPLRFRCIAEDMV